MNKIDKTDTLAKILAHRRFTVDVFQREYRWGRKQIEQMISDFQDTFEEFYDPDNHDTPQEVMNYGYYYMGCIICTGGSPNKIIASPEKAICDQLYTISPCNNRASLQRLLFEGLRIEPTMFTDLDMNALAELAGLYSTKNHKILISLAKDAKRHERVDGGVHVRRYLDVVTGHRS